MNNVVSAIDMEFTLSMVSALNLFGRRKNGIAAKSESSADVPSTLMGWLTIDGVSKSWFEEAVVGE